MRSGVSLFLCILFINPIIVRHDRSEDNFIIDADQYKAVVSLQLKDLTGKVEMEGTFIRQDRIITAAHGLTSVEENQSIKISDNIYIITKIVVHPDWEGFENDLALIQLDRSVPEVTPTPLYEIGEEMNKEITLVGRGWFGTGLTGPVKDDKKKRLATNRIDSVSAHWIKFRFDEPGNSNITELEGISGPGDSGGPAFIITGGTAFLAGISSNQLNEQLGLKEGEYGVIEYYTRVSYYNDWINAVLNNNYEDANFSATTLSVWGFPANELGKKATSLMDAIAQKKITDELIEKLFLKSFRESFDLKGFLQSISESLNDIRVGEIKKKRKNVLMFTVVSEEKTYMLLLETDKRDEYLIGGLIIKKIVQ